MSAPTKDRSVSAVRNYWNAHTLGKQYILDSNVVVGTPEFFEHIKRWMNPFKFPWIIERIEQEAKELRGAHLLEIGCGIGYDSLEFLKRGVKVTATDLTPKAVKLAQLHFEYEDVEPVAVQVENALDLSFEDETFDAVWANGVLHHTGCTEQAIREIRRVLKPGGKAIISHFYRHPSWMYLLSKFGRENIEYKEEDPPVTDFYTESEILAMFDGYNIEYAAQEHFRALPIARSGLKASLYNWFFKPTYNLVPAFIAKRLAYKYSVSAVKR